MGRLRRTTFLFINRLLELFIASFVLSISTNWIFSRIVAAKHLKIQPALNISFLISSILFLTFCIITSVIILKSVGKLRVYFYLNLCSYLVFSVFSVALYAIMKSQIPSHAGIYTYFFMPTLLYYTLNFQGIFSIILLHLTFFILFVLVGLIANTLKERFVPKVRHLNIDEF